MTFPQSHIRILTPVFLFALLAGCAATVPMSDAGSDAAAKQFRPDPAKATIYIVRGAGINPEHLITTQIDGITVGSLAQNTYLRVTVAPGEHTLSVIGPTNQEDLPANVAAGQLYFFQTSMIWAGPGERHRHIEAMTDADGRQYVIGESRAVGINP